MNMSQRANNSAVDLDAAGWTLENAAGRICNITAFADGWINAEFELLGHRDLDLRVFARGSKNADALHATFRSDDRELFLTGILAWLREVGVFGELMSLAEQRLDVLALSWGK